MREAKLLCQAVLLASATVAGNPYDLKLVTPLVSQWLVCPKVDKICYGFGFPLHLCLNLSHINS